MNVYPFFIECSKRYSHDHLKKRFLEKMAIGKGIHVIDRKGKNVMVMPDKEFVIPNVYSDKHMKELDFILWKNDEVFHDLGQQIKEVRKSWQSTRKKDKMFLIYKYVSQIPDITIEEKFLISNVLIMALLLKIMKPSDVIYDGSEISKVDDKLKERSTYTNLNFVYDYSIPSSLQNVSSKKTTTTNTICMNEEEDND